MSINNTPFKLAQEPVQGQGYVSTRLEEMATMFKIKDQDIRDRLAEFLRHLSKFRLALVQVSIPEHHPDVDEMEVFRDAILKVIGREEVRVIDPHRRISYLSAECELIERDSDSIDDVYTLLEDLCNECPDLKPYDGYEEDTYPLSGLDDKDNIYLANAQEIVKRLNIKEGPARNDILDKLKLYWLFSGVMFTSALNVTTSKHLNIIDTILSVIDDGIYLDLNPDTDELVKRLDQFLEQIHQVQNS